MPEGEGAEGRVTEGHVGGCVTGRDWREGRSHHQCRGWGALGEHILQKTQREGAVRRICGRGPWGSSLKQFGATSPSPRHTSNILILLVMVNVHAQAFKCMRTCVYLGGRGTEQKGGRRMARQRGSGRNLSGVDTGSHRAGPLSPALWNLQES